VSMGWDSCASASSALRRPLSSHAISHWLVEGLKAVPGAQLVISHWWVAGLKVVPDPQLSGGGSDGGGAGGAGGSGGVGGGQL